MLDRVVMGLYDEALARWPVPYPYEARTIPTRHGHTYIITRGDPAALPLVLLHGAGTNSSIWAGDVAVYSQHYRVHAIDLLGEAGRGAPNRPDWHSLACADWLADVFEADGPGGADWHLARGLDSPAAGGRNRA
jgi:pimeloyl-ACP methyl ester carboxylesterase